MAIAYYLFVWLRSRWQLKLEKSHQEVEHWCLATHARTTWWSSWKCLQILVPLILHTHWPKLCIVCTEKGRPWQIEFFHPAYPLFSEFCAAGSSFWKRCEHNRSECGFIGDVVRSWILTLHQNPTLQLFFSDYFVSLSTNIHFCSVADEEWNTICIMWQSRRAADLAISWNGQPLVYNQRFFHRIHIVDKGMSERQHTDQFGCTQAHVNTHVYIIRLCMCSAITHMSKWYSTVGHTPLTAYTVSTSIPLSIWIDR